MTRSPIELFWTAKKDLRQYRKDLRHRLLPQFMYAYPQGRAEQEQISFLRLKLKFQNSKSKKYHFDPLMANKRREI